MKKFSIRKIARPFMYVGLFIVLLWLIAYDPTINTYDGNSLSVVSGIVGILVGLPVAWRFRILKGKTNETSKYKKRTNIVFNLAFAALGAFFLFSTIGGTLNKYFAWEEPVQKTIIVQGKGIGEVSVTRYSRVTQYILVVDEESIPTNIVAPKELWDKISPGDEITVWVQNGAFGYPYLRRASYSSTVFDLQ